MTTQIKQLKEKENKLATELSKLRSKICDLERAKCIPDLKKQYEGKFFKNETDYLFTYTKVKNIDSEGRMSTWEFKIYKNTEEFYASINSDGLANKHMLEKEITKKEFNTAYNKMLNAIIKLNK